MRKVIINILSDSVQEGREVSRALCFLNVYHKMPVGPNCDVNVFGGYQKVPFANLHMKGNFSSKQNTINAINYMERNYKLNDIGVIMECDVIPCRYFVRFVREMEVRVPLKRSVRLGYAQHPMLVKYLEDCILKRRRNWVSIQVHEWFGSQFMWYRVSDWLYYRDWLLSYNPEFFQCDTSMRNWLEYRGIKHVQITIPNMVLHIGNKSAKYSGNLRGEGRNSNTWPRQTFCYFEDPYALGGN